MNQFLSLSLSHLRSLYLRLSLSLSEAAVQWQRFFLTYTPPQWYQNTKYQYQYQYQKIPIPIIPNTITKPKTITNTAKTFLSTERCAPFQKKTWSWSQSLQFPPLPTWWESTEHITSNKAASMINKSICINEWYNTIMMQYSHTI